jgi:hypothetical protein
MKFIKTRTMFLAENILPKIGDVILPSQKKEVIKTFGERWINISTIRPTKKIKQGEWELSKEDKFKVLNVLFGCDIEEAQKQYADLPEEFISIVGESLSYLESADDSRDENIKRAKEALSELNLKDVGIDEMIALNYPVLRKFSNETNKTEIIQRDETGRPVMGEDGRPVKIQVEPGAVFEKNLVNLESFRQDYNKYFDNKVNSNFNDRNIQSIINVVKQDHNSEYKTSYKIFNRPVFLKISHNPKDILNMSISKFYTSCQHLYSGGYRNQLIGNVVDPHSIPAFLIVKTPIYNGDELLSEQLPISRSMVRYLDGYDDGQKGAIFFDRTYPDRLRKVMYEMMIKYTGMEPIGTQENNSGQVYTFSPDVPAQAQPDLKDPYMDSTNIKRKKYVGVNTTRLSTSMGGFDKMIISKDANVSELIVDSPDVPAELFNLPLNLDWIKFKFIDIKNMPDTSKFNCQSFAFDKCKFTNEDIQKVIADHKDMTKLQLTSCVVNGLKLNGLDIEELQLVYTTTDPLSEILEGVKFKKLVVSGDLMTDKENQEFVNRLISSGIKVEVVGLDLRDKKRRNKKK